MTTATAWRRGLAPWSLEPTAIDPPTPGPGRVRLMVEAVAVDGFDATPIGRVPGVAAVGTVTAVGAAADEWLGLRVLVPTVSACGECPRCRSGGPAVCIDGARLGTTGPGALVTHLTASARWLVRLDGALALPGPTTAAIGGDLAMAYGLYARAGVGPRDPVLVLGAGPRARFAALVLAAKGCRPVVATDDAATIAAVTDVAAVCAIHTAAIEAALATSDRTRPRRVVVTAPTLVEAALRVAGPRATVVVAADAMTAAAPPLETALAEEVTVVGVAGCHPDLVPELAALVARGDLALADATEVVAVADLAAALTRRAQTRPATALVAELELPTGRA
ncbi:MAG: alcohol dehydrogenase catalytic domain-containing protein [Kofleriaceae bacterium]